MLPGFTLKQLQEKMGYTFKDVSLLEKALTHSSYANERKINKIDNYERLEFLGDAVLELVTSEFLYHEHPEMPEGQLTKLRASYVCEPSLALCAKSLDLGSYLFLGRGEASTGGRGRSSILCDVMEAIIGAVFLDAGIDVAKEYIHRIILNDLEDKALFYDAKTILQEKIQKLGRQLSYKVVKEEGPEHEKVYFVEAYMDEELIGTGNGQNKKSAEQDAAYQALKTKFANE